MKLVSVHNGFGLGCRPSDRDPRDHWYGGHPALMLAPEPEEVDLSPDSHPIMDQSRAGSCVGNGTSRVIWYDFKKQGKVPLWTPSRRAIYYGARDLEGTTDQDCGCQIRDGIKVTVQTGVGPEDAPDDPANCPYDIDRITERPSPAYYAEAKQFESTVYSRVNLPDLASVRRVLAEGLPIVFGFAVYSSFMADTTLQSGIVPMPDPSREDQIGGHCMVFEGYSKTGKSFPKGFLSPNSWGTGVGLVSEGRGGYFVFPEEFVASQLCMDAWVVRTVSLASALPRAA